MFVLKQQLLYTLQCIGELCYKTIYGWQSGSLRYQKSQFESSQQNFCLMNIFLTVENAKVNKKRPRMAQCC